MFLLSSPSLGETTSVAILEASDADEVYRLIDANRAHLARWLPWAAEQTLDGVRAFIEQGLAQFARGAGYHCAIRESGRLVGVIGVHEIDWPNKRAGIGYWLAEDAQGAGSVTRACRAVVDNLFDEMGLQRVEIGAAVENVRSRAVPERLGFKLEGVARGFERVGDAWLDIAQYALLAHERQR